MSVILQQPSKVNVLYSERKDNQKSLRRILPLFQAKNIPIFTELTIPLTRLYDDSYWRALAVAHTHLIAKFDHRHWAFDDETFELYVNRIAAIPFVAIRPFDCPYDYERPANIDISLFSEKLFERTKTAVAILKNNNAAKIVSPSICVSSQMEMYLDYFVHNRCFDIYSLHCCSDFQEQSNALLTALLSQVYSLLARPVWVTRWAAPSCQHLIAGTRTLTKSAWNPMSYAESSAKLKHMFKTVENIVSGNSTWFYTGVEQDEYDPNATLFGKWAKDKQCMVSQKSSWDWPDFLGAITHDWSIKDALLNTVFDIAATNNA